MVLVGAVVALVSPLNLTRVFAQASSIDCYQEGQDLTSLTDDQIIRLCICAENTGPVDCYRRADVTTSLTDEQIIQLCSPLPGANASPYNYYGYPVICP